MHAGLRAHLARGCLVESDDGGHAALRRFARLLHETTALAHDANGVIEGHHARGGEGGEFSEGKAGGGLELQRGRAFLEQFKRDPAHEENSGLRVFGLGEFPFRAGEADAGQVVAQRFIGALEPLPGGGKILGELFAHADRLCALAGKHQSRLAHAPR